MPWEYPCLPVPCCFWGGLALGGQSAVLGGDLALCRTLGLAVPVAGGAVRSAQSAALLWGDALGAETWGHCALAVLF